MANKHKLTRQDSLFLAAELCGLKAFYGGGGPILSLDMKSRPGWSITFGYVNGPLGFTVWTDEPGVPADNEPGRKASDDMPSKDATPKQMAEFIAATLKAWDGLKCPRCGSDHVQPAHGHRLNKCLNFGECGIAFDSPEEEL
jgi:hypothetical protein